VRSYLHRARESVFTNSNAETDFTDALDAAPRPSGDAMTDDIIILVMVGVLILSVFLMTYGGPI
jgi:hypothetical protein